MNGMAPGYLADRFVKRFSISGRQTRSSQLLAIPHSNQIVFTFLRYIYIYLFTILVSASEKPCNGMTYNKVYVNVNSQNF